MTYYIVHNNKDIYTAENQEALSRYYSEPIQVLPDDYNSEKYIVVDGQLILNPEYGAEQLAKAKQNKYNEALTKANEYQQEGFVEYKNCVFEMSDSNRKNLSDTEEALKLMGETETTWLDKDDNYIVLTVEDIQYIRLNLILATIQQLWIVKYPSYKEAIANAETVEEVEAIVIDYTTQEV